MAEKKNCKYCGKEFTPVTAWQEYCSDKHRIADFHKRQREELEQLRKEKAEREQSKKPSGYAPA